ncbi:MAG: 30S ribosomal protein S17 [Nitrospirota bacterium]
MTDAKQLHTLVGTVVRQSGQKSVMVTVTRLVRHPRYQKVIRQVTRVRAHDERSQCRRGDQVEIQACRPISRTKRWRVVQVVKPAELAGVEVNA